MFVVSWAQFLLLWQGNFGQFVRIWPVDFQNFSKIDQEFQLFFIKNKNKKQAITCFIVLGVALFVSKKFEK